MNLVQLIFTLLNTLIKLCRPGGTKALMSENLCLRQQLIVITKDKKRAPNLTNWDRLILGVCASCINPKRLKRLSILLKPETILKFHRALVKKKYSELFSNKTRAKPGPKGPSQEIIDAVVAMKIRNPRFGYLRIAMQISNQFGVDVNDEVVRHILKTHYKRSPDDYSGPSWLTFLGHSKDSLWSIDFFRVESINLKSHWVMVIMDQWSRKIIGFAIHKGDMCGVDVCRMFNSIISGISLPKRISTDHDPLFRYHRWQANLRVLEIDEIKTVPFTPISHPFVERAIGIIREDFLNHILFWNTNDLQLKLDSYKEYFNNSRSHSAHGSLTPKNKCGAFEKKIDISCYKWQDHLQGLIQLPRAA